MFLEIDTDNLSNEDRNELDPLESSIRLDKIQAEDLSQIENISGFQEEEDSNFDSTLEKFSIPKTQRSKYGYQKREKFVNKKEFLKLKFELQNLQRTMDTKFNEFHKFSQGNLLKEQENKERNNIYQIKDQQEFQVKKKEFQKYHNENFQPFGQPTEIRRYFLSQQVSPTNNKQGKDLFLQSSMNDQQNSSRILHDNQYKTNQVNLNFKMEKDLAPNTQNYYPKKFQFSKAKNQVKNDNTHFNQNNQYKRQFQESKQTLKDSYESNLNSNQDQYFDLQIQLQQLREENQFIYKKLTQANQDLQVKEDKIQIKTAEIRCLKEELTEKQSMITNLIQQNQKQNLDMKSIASKFKRELTQKESENQQLQKKFRQLQQQFSLKKQNLERVLDNSSHNNKMQKEELSEMYQNMQRNFETQLKSKRIYKEKEK